MNQPQQEGRYLAQPTEWAVNKTREKQLPQFQCRFSISHQWVSGGWVDVSGDDLEITGYFVLINGDGKVNGNVDNLRDSLGWDGRSFSTLAEGEWSNQQVQLKIESNTFNGKTSMRVRYINPADYEGGMQKADPQEIKSLDQKYGSALRAVAPAPASKAGAPAPASVDPKREAWEAFKLQTPDLTTEQRTEEWRSELAGLFPTKAQDKLTATDWTTAAKHFKQPKQTVPANDPPFGGEQHFKEDDIPF